MKAGTPVLAVTWHWCSAFTSGADYDGDDGETFSASLSCGAYTLAGDLAAVSAEERRSEIRLTHKEVPGARALEAPAGSEPAPRSPRRVAAFAQTAGAVLLLILNPPTEQRGTCSVIGKSLVCVKRNQVFHSAKLEKPTRLQGQQPWASATPPHHWACGGRLCAQRGHPSSGTPAIRGGNAGYQCGLSCDQSLAALRVCVSS